MDDPQAPPTLLPPPTCSHTFVLSHPCQAYYPTLLNSPSKKAPLSPPPVHSIESRLKYGHSLNSLGSGHREFFCCPLEAGGSRKQLCPWNPMWFGAMRILSHRDVLGSRSFSCTHYAHKPRSKQCAQQPSLVHPSTLSPHTELSWAHLQTMICLPAPGNNQI